MSNYITEAFRQFNLLESEDIALNTSGIDELKSFLDDAAVDPDEEMPMDIYDLKAEAEEDLKKSYEGKLVLECTVCHSHIFEDKENMSMNEDGECCKDIECPYCMSNEGYYLLGEIAPYNAEESEELYDEYTTDEDDLPDVDVEGAADEIEEDDIVEESLDDQEANDDEHKDEAEEKIDEGMKLDGVKELYDNDEIRGVEELEGDEKLEGDDRIRGDKHKAPINEGCEDEKLDEGCNKVDEGCDSEKVDESCDSEKFKEAIDPFDRMSDKEKLRRGFVVNGKKEVVVANSDGTSERKIIDTDEPDSISPNKMNESIEDVSVTTEDEVMTMATKDDGGVVIETTPKDNFMGTPEEADGEMIIPMKPETEEIVDVAVDAHDEEDTEDFDEIKDTLEDEEEFTDFDEFDEDSFDSLGESYLRNCYENVNGFKTTGISKNKGRLMIEGMIKFDSGNEKKTNFVFDEVDCKNNTLKLEGYNEQISRGKKTFKLSGKVDDNTLVCESLNYNYRSRNELNESVRVYGTVKKKHTNLKESLDVSVAKKIANNIKDKNIKINEHGNSLSLIYKDGDPNHYAEFEITQENGNWCLYNCSDDVRLFSFKSKDADEFIRKATEKFKKEMNY